MPQYLKDDVIGPFSKKFYGRKGDAVEITARHDEVVIVTNGKETFPVRIEKLSEIPVDGDGQPAVLEPAPVVKPAKGRGTRTTTKVKTKTLF
jgi:hypothetical protein